eukprot:gene24366-29459_t
MEFFLIYIALSSMLSTAHAVVKTAVGPLDYNLASQFPNMNLDGVLASLFTGVTQDKDGNFLASIGNELTSRFAPGSKIASLVAGLGASTANGIQATLAQLSPSGLATDTAGNIYVLEESRHCVRRIGVNGLINTFAGTCGTSGAAVDNVVATSSLLRSPSGVFYHTPTNRLYIADTSNHRIRMVNVATNIITTVMGSAAGSGIAQTFPATSSILTFPDDVWVSSSGVIFVADRGNNRIVRLPPSSTSAAVYAGVRGSAATAYPSGIAATSAGIGTVLVVTGDTSGNIYFGESTGMLYRCTTSNIVFSYAVSSSGGIIHDTPLSNFNYFSINQMIVSSDGRLTFSAAARAGGGVIAQVPVAFTASSPVSVIAGYASRSTNAIPATSVTFRSVNAVWGDTSGAIYVVDATSGVIVKSTAGIVSSVAGTRTVGSMSLIGNTAVAITSRLATMQSIVGDRADNIYFSAQFGVYRVSSTGILSMVAGTDVGTGCNTNWMYTGPGTSVNLCITRALALSSSGVLYISDDAFVIRRLVLSTGILSAIVGRGVMAMATSPVGTVSFTSGLWLDEPRSLLYATDALQVVRRINLTDSNPNRTVTVYAGQLGVSVSTGDNLPATSTTFNNPRGICGSSNGDIYVTLTGPLYIRAVFASTQVAQNFVGTGVAGEGDENTNPLSTPLFTSMSCFVDESRGTLYYGQYSQTGANYGSVRSASQLPIAPSPSPTLLPSAIPTLVPSVEPTESPTAEPSVATASPSEPPTMTLSVVPSALPSLTPSVIPTASPSESHTATPSAVPSATPSVVPTATPSAVPSATPSVVPTATPSVVPTASPSVVPTATPSETPTATPSVVPTATPSVVPTATPSVTPTATPSVVPTATPSLTPSEVPTASPSETPTAAPSVVPTASPMSPSEIPTASPSVVPTATPSLTPSVVPTATPSVVPTATPSFSPSVFPTVSPTLPPTSAVSSRSPSVNPSFAPSTRLLTSGSPTRRPSLVPSRLPTWQPSVILCKGDNGKGNDSRRSFADTYLLTVRPLGCGQGTSQVPLLPVARHPLGGRPGSLREGDMGCAMVVTRAIERLRLSLDTHPTFDLAGKCLCGQYYSVDIKHPAAVHKAGLLALKLSAEAHFNAADPSNVGGLELVCVGPRILLKIWLNSEVCILAGCTFWRTVFTASIKLHSKGPLMEIATDIIAELVFYEAKDNFDIVIFEIKNAFGAMPKIFMMEGIVKKYLDNEALEEELTEFCQEIIAFDGQLYSILRDMSGLAKFSKKTDPVYPSRYLPHLFTVSLLSWTI